MRKGETRRNGVTRGRETTLPLTSRRVWWLDAWSAVYGVTERRRRAEQRQTFCCKPFTTTPAFNAQPVQMIKAVHALVINQKPFTAQ